MPTIELFLDGEPVDGDRTFDISDKYEPRVGRVLTSCKLYVTNCITDLREGQITGSLFGAKFEALAVTGVCRFVDVPSLPKAQPVYSYVLHLLFTDADESSAIS